MSQFVRTTLPLRRLIVAIDPLSNGSPLRILRRWESLMNISIWEDDHYFNRFLRSSILRSVDVNGTSKILINMHRQRQKVFYFQCMRKLKDEGHHWTAFVVSRRSAVLELNFWRSSIYSHPHVGHGRAHFSKQDIQKQGCFAEKKNCVWTSSSTPRTKAALVALRWGASAFVWTKRVRQRSLGRK